MLCRTAARYIVNNHLPALLTYVPTWKVTHDDERKKPRGRAS